MDLEEPLVDYFIVCGAHPSTELEIETSAFGGEDVELPPLEKSFKAAILSRFPDNRKTRPFYDELLSLCMPLGVRICTQRDLPAEPVYHSFMMTREDGSRVDGCALTFYEQVMSDAVRDQIHRMQSDFVNKEVVGDAETEFYGTGLTYIRESRNPVLLNHPPGQATGGVHTLPRRRGVSANQYSLIERSKRTSFYDFNNDILYISKTIAIVTCLPIMQAVKSLLRKIHLLATSAEEPDLPIESYIFWLLYELPTPAAGSTLRASLCDVEIICQRPGDNELPLFDYSLEEVLTFFTLDRWIKLYTCALLEHQILFCSKYAQRLMLCAESLTTILWPFRWQQIYVPILPHSHTAFLEAPGPFIMGLCYDDEIPPEVYKSTITVVDIDKGYIEFPEGLPLFPHRAELLQELHSIIMKFTQRTQIEYPRHSPPNSKPPMMPVRRAYNENNLNLESQTEQKWKRISRSFDDEGFMDTPSGFDRRKQLQPLNLQTSEQGWQDEERMFDEDSSTSDTTEYVGSSVQKRYFNSMRFNNAVREMFLSKFVRIFHSYEHFLIRERCKFVNSRDYFENRDSVHTFDKNAFLSDQPDSQLNFLAAFLETQMFATLIDSKIIAQWEEPDAALKMLDMRIFEMSQQYGESMVRTPCLEQPATQAIERTEKLINQREQTIDYIISPPHPLNGVDIELARKRRRPGAFPILQRDVLTMQNSLPSPQRSPWHHNKAKEESPQPVKMRSTGHHSASTVRSPKSAIARPLSTYGTVGDQKVAHWKFNEQLLSEIKAKTKRMLVEKMGKEAFELGHSNIVGVEENTLVASFCDLLERIWAHALIKKKGKSELWNHLVAFSEEDKCDFGHHLHPAIEHQPSARHHQHRPDLATTSRDEDTASGVVQYLQSLQKDMTQQQPMAEDDQAWSSSLLRAASTLFDKLSAAQQTVTTQKSTIPSKAKFSIWSSPQQTRQSQQIKSKTNLIRHSSFSDLAPNWSLVSQDAAQMTGLSFPHDATLPKRRHQATKSNMHISGAIKEQQSLRLGSQQNLNNQNHHYYPSYTQGTAYGTSPRKQRSLSRPRSPDIRAAFPPLPTNIGYDLKNICRLTDIKTDIGYARAFVRLALERKLLYSHVQTLLGNRKLLASLYKRHAFLRQDDEVEQVLYHILSLNATDFKCFTNSFPKIKMQYQVLLVPGGGKFTLASVPAQIWVRLAGGLAQTPQLNVPENCLQFQFDHRNLGVLSTLRIGHRFLDQENGNNCQQQELPKWFLEEVLVRCELTGTTYRFPCGRWFGKKVDDGSLERLLVAEQIDVDSEQDGSGIHTTKPYESNTLTSRSRTPTRARSPSSSRKGSVHNLLQHFAGTTVTENPRAQISALQHQLGDKVNTIVRHFHGLQAQGQQMPSEKAALTQHLCGEGGLVSILQQVFLVNFKSTRAFRSAQYPWDYIHRTCQWFYDALKSPEAQCTMPEQRIVMKKACKLCARVGINKTMGKEGKFQTFLLLTIRDKLLPGVLPLMAWTPVTGEFYEDPSFIRTVAERTFLVKLLESLNDFQFELDSSLTYGVDTSR